MLCNRTNHQDVQTLLEQSSAFKKILNPRLRQTVRETVEPTMHRAHAPCQQLNLPN